MAARGKRLALLGLVTLGALMGAELGYRSLLGRAYQQQLERSGSDTLWQRHPRSRCVYSMRPGKRRSMPGGWTLRTNVQGFRGRSMKASAAGVQRVLVLGDSFTFGWGVEQDQAYPRQLEALLGRGGRQAVVFNAAVPGYNTEQQSCMLAQIWDMAAPDVVLLGYVVNDAEPQHTVPSAPHDQHRFVRVWLWELLKQQLNRLGSTDDPLFQPRVMRHSLDYLRGFAPASPKWRASKQALARIARRCEQHKVPLKVIMLPDFDEHFDESYRQAPIHAAVKAWGKELGVPVYDLLDRLRGKDRTLYRLAEGHPNARGHAEIAAFAAAVLNKN